MPDPIVPPINQQIAKDEGRTGLGKIIAGIVTGFFTTYLMNQASLHGVDFEAAGVSSEVVKSAINSALIGASVAFTPAHFVACVKDYIIFIKKTQREWRNAWENNE